MLAIIKPAPHPDGPCCRDNETIHQAERSSHELLATLRRVSTQSSGSHQESNPGQSTSSTFELASQLWPSTFCSALCLPTVFQVGTPLGFEAFRAFPSRVAANGSSPPAVLRAVHLEKHRSVTRAAASRMSASQESVSDPARCYTPRRTDALLTFMPCEVIPPQPWLHASTEPPLMGFYSQFPDSASNRS